MANPSKPSWRRGSSRKIEANTEKGWQSSRVSTTKSAVSGHRVKLLALGLFVLALVATFVIAVWRRPLATPMIVASITKYATTLPPNSFAKEDALRLAAANPKNVHSSTPLEGKIDRSGLKEYLLRQIEKLPAGGPGKNVVMLYLSAHGALNGNGEPCLILSDASPIDTASWLKMSELIELFKARPNVKKVVFLDAGQLDSLWSAGILYSGFPEQLEKQLAEAAVPNLYVISSASNGQRAWSAPELGGSVFGYYVARGLQGAARSDDDQITLQELTRYLEREVARHVSEQRASEQTPRLLTPVRADQDFGIAYTGGSSITPSIESQQQDRKQIAARWKQVHAHWQQFEERLAQRRGPSSDPVRTAQLQHELLRMEQYLLAGGGYADEFNAADSRARTLLNEIGKEEVPPDVTAFSFPLYRQLNSAAEVDPKVASTLAAWRAADGKPPLKKDEKPPAPLEYLSATQIAWNFLLEHERPRHIHVRDLLTLVDESGGRRNAKGDRTADFVEVHFLRMLDRFVDRAASGEFSDIQQSAIYHVLLNRSLAEQATSPDDERVHLWNHPLVNDADLSRRLAEDQLFGEPTQPVAQDTLKDAATKYRQALSRAQFLAETLALRDQVSSELPYLVMWFARSSGISSSAGTEISNEQLAETAEKVADQTLTLAATLDDLLAAGKVDDFATLQPLADEVRQSFQALRSTFVTYCQELKDRGSEDRVTLREIGEVLQVPSPLLAADERERLANSYVKKVFELSELLTAPGPQKSKSDAERPAGPSTRSGSIAKREFHPAVHLLNRAHSRLLTNRGEPEPKLTRGSESDVVWLARQGERVRTWLKSVDQAASDLEDDTKNRLKDSKETPANIRAGVSEADRLIRAAAPLASTEIRDPSFKLRYVDRHFQWLWQAQRTLDDFWGPSPGKENTQSYFASVAAAYIAGARQFDDTPTSPSYDRNGKDLREILSDRIAAAQGTILDPRDVRTLGDQPLASHSVHLEWHPQLPVPGVAALYLEGESADGQRALIPVKDDAREWRRQMLRVGSSAQVDVSHRVPIDRLGSQGGNTELTASLLYRGHLLQRPFQIGRPESVFVAKFDPNLPPRAKVTVKGEGKRRVFIALILDCSGSMRADDGGGRRMDAAKGAVLALLNSLELGPHYQVGLRAYSSRYRFSGQIGPNGKYVVVDRAGAPIVGNPDANPDKDVDLLVRMDELTAQHRQRIREEVNKLEPNGVTPLYHSIAHALIDVEDDFQFADADDLRHIIVITDGINETQYDHTTVDKVLGLIQSHPKARDKRVDIVLFQEQKVLADPGLLERHGAAKIRRELNDIKQVAAKSGGNYFPANNPDQLVEALRDALKLVKFSVTPVGAPRPGESALKELGQDQVVPVKPDQPGQYRVELHPASDVPPQNVVIEGGEAIELEYDKTRDRLVFPRYFPGDERALPDDYEDPQSREHFFVTPILPKKTLNRVAFEIAIQNVDPEQFTPRPKNVWVQIDPLSDGDQRVAPTYHFYDAQFAPDTPVPVFQFVVNDWPASATKAAIELWFKFGTPAIKPNGVLRVKPGERNRIEEDIPNVEFAAELIQPGQATREWRLHVVERHNKGTELFTSRVQATPTAGRVSHSFYIGVDEVRHEFDYSGETSPTAIVTSRERVIEHAVAVPRFIRPVKEN